MGLYLGNNKVTLKVRTLLQYNVVGTPTIENEIISNFKSTNYLTLPSAFTPNAYVWEFRTKFSINGFNDISTLIDRTTSTRCFQIAITKNRTMRIVLSMNGSAKTVDIESTLTINGNQWYYLSLKYIGTQYQLNLSTDGDNWTQYISVNNSNPIFSGATLRIGNSWYNDGTEPFNGYIDLAGTYFTIDNTFWGLRINEDTFQLNIVNG